MDIVNKSITSNFKNLYPKSKHLSFINTTEYNPEFVSKSLSERDIYQISNKFISHEEWDVITTLLTKPSSFHTLSLSGINIDSYGLKKLSEILSSNKQIKTLKLEWNYLNEYIEEFDYLCDVISNGYSIINLFLNNNKLNSNHASSLCKIIKTNISNFQMDLRWNEISLEGGKEISKALINNNSIQELILTGNSIPQDILFEINEKLNKNKSGLYNANFNIESNKISNFPEYLNSLLPTILLNKRDSNFHSVNSYLSYFKNRENIVNEDDENQGKYLIKKEKDLTNEYKARYDSQLVNNGNLEKKVRELEILLNNEQALAEDFRINNTRELQCEKDKIVQYENQILKQKEEFIKKELDWKKLLGDSEKEISKLLQEKHDLYIENNLLKNQIKLQKEINDDKCKLLEDYNSKGNLTLQNNFDNIKIENESIRRNCEEQVKSNNKEWDRKFKNAEEYSKILKSSNDQLEKEISNIRKEITDMKINKDFDAKERESRIIEEEV